MYTVLFDTTDLREAEAILSANFSRLELGSRSSDAVTRTRMVRSNVGSLTVDDTYFSCDTTYRMDPPEKIALCRVYSGVIEGQHPGHQRDVFGEGQVAAIGALDELPIVGGIHEARYAVLSVDRKIFSEVVAGQASGYGKSVRLTGQAAVSPEANQYLVDVIDHICKKVATNPHAAQSPFIASAVQRYLAAAMLSTFPNTGVLDPTIEDRRDSTPILLRRAIAFVDENAHRDISSADVAAAVYVTPRALQYMFRKHRDCTPMEYLRRVRLHQARLDLVAGNRATITVGAIARRWGFGHLGRFAVLYREHYGESPHETLRR